ncbi:hypothetical protein FOPG_03912 [Fusarium oxysporum f. sp. conglutinans race 2 54008]|uniref:Uncharacterized protein n=1 Tax=Fusarium oxysporum f. sp. conglutinans race 2 54008 TaxID=1089457 RepID=X0IHG4_FUSOX|nr:hypothetical protein FOPG_03912 [Fusarium oxysporum f. sp. conglutinans race 2 54008]
MASVKQRKTLDGERQRVGELVQPPREVSHQPPGQRHLEGHPMAWIAPRSRNRLVMEST